MTKLTLSILAAAALAAGCSREADAPRADARTSPPAKTAITSMPTFEAPRILERIKVLSSDEFQGRAPGTKGEELTVKYLEDEFRKLGLKPGNTDGTYIQNVPLVGITATNTQPLTIAKGSETRTFKWSDDVVAWARSHEAA